MSLLKAFNNHLKEFIDDIIRVFPKDVELKATKFFIIALIKTRPKEIITIWKLNIISSYAEQINKGDYNFFARKNYAYDIGEGINGNKTDLLESIGKMQKKIADMNTENKEKAMKYVQNLTKLCKLYFIDNQ